MTALFFVYKYLNARYSDLIEMCKSGVCLCKVLNQRSLEKMQRIEEQKKAAMLPKLPYQGPLVRYHSKINTIDTITFSAVDEFPTVINAVAPPYPLPQKCAFTGLPAKYKDPLTGRPYANAAAFKELRTRHSRKK